jgi:hypothetical protein
VAVTGAEPAIDPAASATKGNTRIDAQRLADVRRPAARPRLAGAKESASERSLKTVANRMTIACEVRRD